MKISEIMTPHSLTVSADQTLAEAVGIMKRMDTGFLPVGEDDRLVGMLTDRDVALRAIGAGKGAETTVREVMTEEVCYCHDDDEIEVAAQSMGMQQVRRLPVIDRDKRLVGVVSLGDIALHAPAETAGVALEDIVRPHKAGR